MKTCLDNASLIEEYIQGKASFEANPELRIETIDNRVQLLEKNGKLVAIKEIQARPATVLVRHDSKYIGLIQQSLQRHCFAPDQGVDNIRLVPYRKFSVPPNYNLKFNEAVVLWKTWWRHYRFSRRSSLQLDLLLMVRQKWYPLNNIACDRGTLFIKTLIGEVILDRTDIAIWLERRDS